MRRIRTNTSVLSFDGNGILHKTVIENSHIDLAAIKESDEATRKFTKGKKVLVLYDARHHFTLTEDAMEYAQKEVFNKQRMATAIVSDKVGIKITADYMMNVMKSPIPIKVFSNKREALKWLLSFKNTSSTKKTISTTSNLTRFSHKKTNRLTTNIADVWFDNNGILFKKVKENVLVDIDAVKKSFEMVKVFTGNKKTLVLYDASAHFIITEDAMEHMQNNIFAAHNIATAVVSNKIGVRIMADYLVNVKRLKAPLQVFSNEKEAISWLLTLKKANAPLVHERL